MVIIWWNELVSYHCLHELRILKEYFPLPLNSLGMSLKIYPVVILMLMRLFSRKYSYCCLASWRKNKRMSPLAGIRIFLAYFESLCPKHVCFNISHQLIDSLHIYDKFPGQHLSAAFMHKPACLPVQLLQRGKVWGVTHCSPNWRQLWRWPQRYHGFSGLGPGTCWGDLDGNFTRRLQGQSQHSPPSIVTVCQSLHCVCIDAKSQAAMKVLLSGPQSRISILVRKPVCSSWEWALFPGTSDWSEDPFFSLLWWQTCGEGIWDCHGHPAAALAARAGQELQGLGQPRSPI